MSEELSKVYDPKTTESKWYALWEEKGYFGADADGPGDSTHPRTGNVYCITIPPPNVTGNLHMGHALNHSVHDLLIRWNRMQGKLTLCVPGTDHASIAVHTVLEKELAKEGTSRNELGREKFLERAWAWREHYGGVILKQMRLLGCSYDWPRERFTMDEHYNRAVQHVFVEWFHKGWVYRGYRIINWCPRCQTSLSDLEAPMVEQPGTLWHIRYPIKSGLESGIVVATTRPETMLGDTAVAVNPQDERYQHLIGKTAILPLMDREIPIVADEFVDREFGSGAVKVTPAHDPNDFEVGKRHGLPQVLVIGKDACMTAETKHYAGMDRYDCREAVVSDLAKLGLLVKGEDYPTAKLPRCARCDTVLEPLPLKQWFVDMNPMAQRAVEVIEAGKVRYIPERYTGIALEWLHNLRDWNISRQLWWGQRIPAWQCRDDNCAKWTVQVEPPTQCAHCGGNQLEQDPDVFDTWFSSGVWPQTVLGYPDDTPEMKKFFPTSLLITARDILHLWVARMIMSSLDFLDEIPFYDVYVHPTILNWEGRRMSKSLGTGVDPLDLINEYGADATRFGLLYMCSITQDVRFTEERIEMARNFCNKIWNASRFTLMNIEGFAPSAPHASSPSILPLADRWILSRLHRTIGAVSEALSNYNFDVASRAIYDFVWSEFCDWYIEMSKAALRSEGKALAQQTLAHVLETTLRMLHPFMPFLTEEIWQSLPNRQCLTSGDAGSIMLSPYPESDASRFDDAGERQMQTLMEVIRSLRNLRAELKVPPGQKVVATLIADSEESQQLLEAEQVHIVNLAQSEPQVLRSRSAEKPTHAVSAVVEDIHVYISLEGLVDLDKERGRLEKEIEQITDRLDQTNQRLQSPNFTERAPAEVVQKERDKAAELEERISKLRNRLASL